MDLFGRLSAAEYRSLAARWRRLAAEATTPQTRNHLLGLVRQCEFLAGAGAELVREEREEPGLLAAPR
jgi:hypothetical protein